MKYLLDTNAWATYLRGKDARFLKRFSAELPQDLVMSTVVLSELYYGAQHSGPANINANLILIKDLLTAFVLLDYDRQSAEVYGTLREHLTVSGTRIGPNDTLIAATALAHQLIVVTHNTTEFSRVPGLLLEDWQLP